MKVRFFLAEALRSIRQNAATTIAALVTVLIVTILLGTTVTIGKWVYDKTQELRGDVTLKLYFTLPEENPERTQALSSVEREVAQLPFLRSMEYVSPEEAKAKLSPQARKELNTLPFNPLPPAFYVKLTDPEQAALVRDRALEIKAIRECGDSPCADYGERITERVLTITKVILGVVAGLMILLGVAAVVLIANTIRLSIFARRREIEVMKLVGATNWFVRLPFVLEGMLTGLVGALVGIALLGVGYQALDRTSSGLADPARSVGLGLLVAMLAAFGLLLGAFGSGLTLRRFLKV